MSAWRKYLPSLFKDGCAEGSGQERPSYHSQRRMTSNITYWHEWLQTGYSSRWTWENRDCSPRDREREGSVPQAKALVPLRDYERGWEKQEGLHPATTRHEKMGGLCGSPWNSTRGRRGRRGQMVRSEETLWGEEWVEMSLDMMTTGVSVGVAIMSNPRLSVSPDRNSSSTHLQILQEGNYIHISENIMWTCLI